MYWQADTTAQTSRALRDATFAVVDVETTGIDANVDRVVEVACAIVRSGEVRQTFRSFVDPGRAIPANATAVHGIRDSDVRNAPRLADLRARLESMCENAIVVAHNARFDLAFLPFLRDRPVICSMRFAMRVIPDAPNYRNQGLREHLGFTDDFVREAVPHRALGDVLVTSRVLTHCLERYRAMGGADDVDTMIHEIAAPRRLDALPFGRHRGRAISSLPADYLRWLHDEARSASRDARYTAACELARRGASASG
jgi:DNA polymerase III epsilon subunit-like protein